MKFLSVFAAESGASPSRSLNTVQVARGVAAAVVVLHHAVRGMTIKSHGGIIAPALIGQPRFYDTLAIGVDLFFVISGFIMVYVSGPYFFQNKSLWDFLRKRVLRIYPTYIVVTALLIAIAIARLALSGASSFDLQPHRIVGSLLLWPTANESGTITPILGVGWTLSYEMYFYIAFVICVSIFRKNFFLPLAALITAAIAISSITRLNWDLITFLRNPIAFEFLMGCGLGLLVRRGILCPAPWFALAAAAILPFLLPMMEFGTPSRFMVWGIPSAIALYALITIDVSGKAKTIPGIWLFLGNASFSIYLLHSVMINMVGVRIAKYASSLGFSDVAMLGVVLAVAAGSILPGMVLYLLFEKPVSRALGSSKIFAPRPRAAA